MVMYRYKESQEQKRKTRGRELCGKLDQGTAHPTLWLGTNGNSNGLGPSNWLLEGKVKENRKSGKRGFGELGFSDQRELCV